MQSDEQDDLADAGEADCECFVGCVDGSVYLCRVLLGRPDLL